MMIILVHPALPAGQVLPAQAPPLPAHQAHQVQLSATSVNPVSKDFKDIHKIVDLHF